MTEPVELPDIKLHLKLEADDAEEDAYLTALLVGARRACEARIGVAAADLAEDDVIVLGQAIRLIVGHWYRNRESVAVGTIATAMPNSATWLLEPLVSFAGR